MSSLDGYSTLAEIEAAYADNISYEEDQSVAKARAFITACQLLIGKRASALGAANSVQFGDQAQLQRQIDHARQWLAANDTSRHTGSVRFLDFSNVRR